jgi:uncharacterized protein (DUF697 family)
MLRLARAMHYRHGEDIVTVANPLVDYSPQMEVELLPGDAAHASRPGVFGDLAEMELTAELLAVHDEGQLDQFLGTLIRGAGEALGKIVGAPAGAAIGNLLKGLARRALPVGASVLGGVVGGPLGAQLAGALASRAGSALGLELEGLSSEDREFEAARHFVRYAGSVVGHALQAPAGRDPARVARDAALEAARVHAPGLTAHIAHVRRHDMHDIDRTQVGHETEQAPYGYEMEDSELVGELMEVQSEEEFEQFLGSLLARAVSAAGGFLSTPTGKALGGLLKGAARQILPVVQQVAGSGTTGELEDEDAGMSEAEMEALELEAAQTFVNLAQEAAVNAAQAPQDADPAAVAHKAVADAAQVHAPALLGRPSAGPPPIGQPVRPKPSGCQCSGSARAHGGRWIRRGNRIIVYGA